MLLVRTQIDTVSGGAIPVATAYIHGGATPSVESPAQLKEIFRLTNTEARIALALSQGSTLVEAADLLNITSETARYYSKRIYSKTGARNQADLVRIVLSNVAALS